METTIYSERFPLRIVRYNEYIRVECTESRCGDSWDIGSMSDAVVHSLGHSDLENYRSMIGDRARLFTQTDYDATQGRGTIVGLQSRPTFIVDISAGQIASWPCHLTESLDRLALGGQRGRPGNAGK